MLLPIISLLASLVFAQTPVQTDLTKFGGLEDTEAAAVAGKHKAQELLNVETTPTGSSIRKRKGYALQASLGLSTAPVLGSFRFQNNNGDVIDIVCQDRYCASSRNDAAFTNFLTTASADIRFWNFVVIDGFAYGANSKRDPIFKFNGTALSHPITSTGGVVVALLPSRMVVANLSGLPNRICYSEDGNFINFNGGVEDEDAFCDDLGSAGDQITAVKFCNGLLYYFKSTSFGSCQVDTQYNTRCEQISDNVGTAEAVSPVCTPQGMLWKAQEGTYWQLDGSGYRQISKGISNLVKSQASGILRSRTETEQSDWEAGVQFPTGTWDTASLSGSIFPSSVTFVETFTSSHGFTLSGLSFEDGLVKMSSDTLRDNWEDGNFTSGPSTWTVTAGSYFIQSSALVGETVAGNMGNLIHSTSLVLSSASWSWDWFTSGPDGACFQNSGGNCYDFRFIKQGNGDFYSFRVRFTVAECAYQLVKSVSGTETIMASTSKPGGCSAGSSHSFQVVRSTDGRIFSYTDGVFVSSTTDTALTTSQYVEIGASRSNNRQFFNNVYINAYKGAGTLTSPWYDTRFSTPTWGPFGATITIPTDGNIAFYTQTSSNTDVADSIVSTSDTLRITSSQKRYIRLRADFYNPVTTNTVTLLTASLPATTTGQFRTQCIQPESGITAWGVVSCASALSGAGSIIYYATSAVSCATLPTSAPSNWANTITNNATLTISTNTALYLGFRSLMGSTTDQARLDACAAFWANGTLAKPSWAVYNQIDNYVGWTTTIGTSTANNYFLKYDLNVDEWYPWTLPVNAPIMLLNDLYFGSSLEGKWYRFGHVDSDEGAAINSYWRSADIASANPYQERQPKSLSLIARNELLGSLTVQWYNGRAGSGSYSVSTSTSSSIPYVRSNYGLPQQSPSSFFSIKVGNNSITPWEVLGIRLDQIESPWRALNP